MKKETLQVEGMSCNHCVNAIKGALEKIEVEAQIDLATKKVSVSYDERQVELAQIKETITDQGYDIKE
ncbi:heavy-metal-associated domain-containing protein [Hazenella sp. IB182357]|uniref:Heavy-metal-associated domain-containing protein n=1 Tax=Polycladospora coralii TaxID=2771432 RepID=A0A926NGF1_9BACL|nr:copper ion binding protein [Polycladospora coralii]MBD1373119.1 heavy-metal-associated domain-containing protein [Polycladospora coralii]MBS7531677.1 heavy-metal-associated domain-containing protein [Polycladospora coralii]